MTKGIFANSFGLIALMSLSLFASTAAFAGAGPSQVIVTNTPAQPVPVTLAGKQPYQANASADMNGNPNYSLFIPVPSGQKFVVEHVNIIVSTYDPNCTYQAFGILDAGSKNIGFSLSLGKYPQPTTAGLYMFGGDSSVELTASQNVTIWLQAPAVCSGSVANLVLSGYLTQ